MAPTLDTILTVLAWLWANDAITSEQHVDLCAAARKECAEENASLHSAARGATASLMRFNNELRAAEQRIAALEAELAEAKRHPVVTPAAAVESPERLAVREQSR